MQAKLKALTFLIVAVLAGTAAAEVVQPKNPRLRNPDLEERQQGYYFYNEKQRQEKQDENDPERQIPGKPEKVTAAWLRENLPVLKERMLDNPTPNNAALYLWAQNQAMAMADRVTTASLQAVMMYPELRNPSGGANNTLSRKLASQAAEEAMDAILQNMAIHGFQIAFFYDPDCPYCKASASPLTLMNVGFDMPVIAYNIKEDGRELQNLNIDPSAYRNKGSLALAKKLQISAVPSYAIFDAKGNFVQMLGKGTTGALAYTQLKREIVDVLWAHGKIEPEVYQKTYARPKRLAETEETYSPESNEAAQLVKSWMEQDGIKIHEVKQ